MACSQVKHVVALLLALCLGSVLADYNYKQVQFYEQSVRYGVSITSALLANGTYVRMHLTAPTRYSWFALGSGSVMDKSVMFIFYPNAAGNGLTLSIRTTRGHDDPTLVADSHIDASILTSSIKGDTAEADIEWRGDTRGVIYDACSVKDVKQPFIWALGPEQQPIASDDENFQIRKHGTRGIFFANMIESQNYDIRDPVITGTANTFVTPQPAYYLNLMMVHACVLIAAFVAIFPGAVISLRLNMKKSFSLHWMGQLLASVLAVAGLGLGIGGSILGVRYNNLTEPHQLIGILVILLIGLQIYFGREHHIHYFLYKKRTWYSYVHMSLGRVIMYGGMANVTLGFSLAGLRDFAIALGCISIAIIIAIEFFSARNQVRLSKHLIVSAEPLELGHYHKIADVTVTELTLNEVESGKHRAY